MSASKVLRFWVPVLLWTAFIFWLSSAPRKAPPILRFPGADKLIHLGEYTPLGLLLLRAVANTWVSLRLFRQGAAALAAGAAIGIVDELFQGFVPTRQVSPWDFLADVAGVLLGLLIYRVSSARTP